MSVKGAKDAKADGSVTMPWSVGDILIKSKRWLMGLATEFVEMEDYLWPKEMITLILDFLPASNWMAFWFNKYEDNSLLDRWENLWWFLRFGRDAPSLRMNVELFQIALNDSTIINQMIVAKCVANGVAKGTQFSSPAMEFRTRVLEHRLQSHRDFQQRNGYAAHDATTVLDMNLTSLVMKASQYQSCV